MTTTTTTPISSAFFESAAQMQELATQRLHRAMRGVDEQGRPIPVPRQMEEVHKAQAEMSSVQAGLAAYKKLLEMLQRSA